MTKMLSLAEQTELLRLEARVDHFLTNQEAARRQRAIDFAIANVGLEGQSPGPDFVRYAPAFVAGRLTVDEFSAAATHRDPDAIAKAEAALAG